MASYNGVVVYEGPSVIDGSPIFAVLTNLGKPSKNAKTGDMSQMYIMRSDMHPVDAVQTGNDSAICGDCKHRGTMGGDTARTCYVEVAQAPTSVFRARERGAYLPFNSQWPLSPAEAWGSVLWGYVSRKPMRLGAYGDPAAVPAEYIRPLVNACKATRVGWTGYSHTWQSKPEVFAAHRHWLMASVDNADEAVIARQQGLRYFRVTMPGESADGEMQCAAVRENNPLHCARCRACSGSWNPKAPSVYIEVHGNRAEHFTGR